jgi:hypothetical protein
MFHPCAAVAGISDPRAKVVLPKAERWRIVLMLHPF